MIVVKVEIWPFGEAINAKELAEFRIINDNTGSTEFGNYKVRHLLDDTVEETVFKRHKRRLHVLHLVARALKSLGYV